MKIRLLISVIILLTYNAAAQNNYLFDFNGTKLGGYIGTAGKYSTLNGESAGYLDFKGAVVINENWGIGLSVSGLYYDKALSEFVDDGTYHLYIGYSGIYVERIFSFTDDFKFALSILSGYGEAFYQYDKDYRDEKLWNEEIIDKTSFYVFEPGMEIEHRLSRNFWMGLTASVRTGSPLQLYGVSEHFIHKLSYGISVKYGVF